MGRVSEKFDLTLVVYNADGKLVREVTIKGGTPQKLENASATSSTCSRVQPSLRRPAARTSRK